MDLVETVYQLARALPSHELYELSSQIRRAVVSIPANIAEGHARSTTRDYAHFVSIARGSLMEAETLLEIAQRLHYLTEPECQLATCKMNEIERMLAALLSRLKG